MILLYLTENIPKIGESIVASQILTQLGGKASNQAVAISRLGVHAYLLSKTGTDQWASMAFKLWNQEEVDISCVSQDDHQNTGMGIVVIDRSGQNVTLSAIGANKFLNIADVKNIMHAAEQAKVMSIHLNAPQDVIYCALYEAKTRGMITIFNASPLENIPLEFYKLTDIFVVNNIEASFYSGIEVRSYEQGLIAGEKIINRGSGKAIVTFGEDGLVLITQSEQHYIPAFRVKAIDTTGAGDAFIAGLAVALAEGKDILSAARFGCAVSAMCVSKIGTLTSMPLRKDVDEFLAKRP